MGCSCWLTTRKSRDLAAGDLTSKELREAKQIFRRTRPLVMDEVREIKCRSRSAFSGFDPTIFNHVKRIGEVDDVFELTLHLPERRFRLRVWATLTFTLIHSRDGPSADLPTDPLHQRPSICRAEVMCIPIPHTTGILLRKSVPSLLLGRTKRSNPI